MLKEKGIMRYFFVVFLFLGMYLSIVQRLVSEIALSFALSNTLMSLIIMATFIGYFISPILMGELSDRAGRRLVMAFSFAAMIVGLLIIWLVNEPVAIGIGILINGMAFGAMEMSMSSIISDIHTNQVNRVMNMSRMFFALGTISGPFIAIGFLDLLKDWRYAMVFMLTVMVILYLIFILISYPRAKYPNEVVKKTQQTPVVFILIKNKMFIAICVSIMMYVAVEAGLTFYASKYIGQFSTSSVFASFALSSFWLFVAVGRFLSSKLESRLHTLILGLAGIAILGLSVAMFSTGLAFSIISFGIMGLGCSGIFPTLLALGRMAEPKYAGAAFGVLLSSAAIGGIIQPYIMGAVADAYSLKLALAVCFVPLIIIIVLQTIIRKKV